MVPDINFLLVGNSRLHWAKYSKNQSKFFHTNQEQKVPENIDLDQLIWASVGKFPNFSLKEENEIKTKDIQLSNLPDYFGIDRARIKNRSVCYFSTLKGSDKVTKS